MSSIKPYRYKSDVFLIIFLDSLLHADNPPLYILHLFVENDNSIFISTILHYISSPIVHIGKHP